MFQIQTYIWGIGRWVAQHNIAECNADCVEAIANGLRKLYGNENVRIIKN